MHPLLGECMSKHPEHYPIKIIATQSDEAKQAILAVIHTHFPLIKPDCITSKHSKNGNYCAITLTVSVHNEKAIDAMHQALKKMPEVIMVL